VIKYIKNCFGVIFPTAFQAMAKRIVKISVKIYPTFLNAFLAKSTDVPMDLSVRSQEAIFPTAFQIWFAKISAGVKR
jgi:hypothetical protein